MKMNVKALSAPLVEGSIYGLIVVILLIAFHTPIAFAIVVGIIIGAIAVFILKGSSLEN
ncbi:hypothetical protein Metfor_2446 [Methanoregula formicica SMSP]|uniref:Uncharacterized protein n=2 Tax=Methanoregula formicica TaxID=882104 RepID=L0HI33_METFS|nr:hypothetical protein Metfor_2446 [Methanoregula formicica SMSP]